MTNENCLFCGMVAGTIPHHKVWEDAEHLAFLTIFPNTEGVTVVIPKEHHSSYIFGVPEDVMTKLMQAAKIVAGKLDATFDDVGRTGVVFEGFGVDHLHAKLYPLHGTAETKHGWKPMESGAIKTYFAQYPGYISSNDSERADDAELAKLAQRLREGESA